MSLNADVTEPHVSLEELLAGNGGSQEVGQSNVLSVAAADAPTAVINVDMREGASPATTLNQDEIDLLPQLHNKINLISEDGEKLIEMEDLQSDIENRDAMAMVDADEVNATFEGFYNETRTVKRFTKTHSKVGLADTKKFMTAKVSYTRECLVSDFRQVISTDAPAVVQEMQSLQTDGIDKAVDIISNTCFELTEVREKLNANPNLIFPFQDGTFLNLGKEDLCSIDIDKVNKETPISCQEFNVAFNTLVSIWKSDSGVRILSVLAQGGYEEGGIQAAFSSNEAPPPIGLTLDVLVRMFASSKGVDYSAWLVEAASGEINELNGQIDQANQVIDNQQAAQAFITQSSSKLSSIVSQMGRVKSTVINIAKFAEAALFVVKRLATV